ncbi:MAG: OmpH family outer membrane protein [Kiritimatiellae bacterium]|nr:OmpH family outer membrane protein [Kiritimatiellia bacterium]
MRNAECGMRSTRCGLLVALLLVSVTFASAAGDLGVVDMDQLVKAHPKADVNREILRDQFAELESEKDAMIETFEGKKREFLDARRAAADPAVSDAVRAEREEEVNEQLKDLQAMEKDLGQRLMERQRELNDQKLRMHKLVEEAVQKLVTRVATKKDLSLVIDKSAVGVTGSGIVVFHTEKLDITDLVMKEIQVLRDED